MKYITVERKKAERILQELFDDPGGGFFLGKPRAFVLTKPELNLWEPIRKDALEYFKKTQSRGGKERINHQGICFLPRLLA